MNERSSRSHTVFRIVVESKVRDDEASGVLVGALSLVDLAGSESVRLTGASGLRAKEGGKINTSLLTLSRVIKQLGEGQRSGGEAFVKLAPVVHEILDDASQLRRVKRQLAELLAKQKEYDELGASGKTEELAKLLDANAQLGAAVEAKEADLAAQVESVERLKKMIRETWAPGARFDDDDDDDDGGGAGGGLGAIGEDDGDCAAPSPPSPDRRLTPARRARPPAAHGRADAAEAAPRRDSCRRAARRRRSTRRRPRRDGGGALRRRPPRRRADAAEGALAALGADVARECGAFDDDAARRGLPALDGRRRRPRAAVAAISARRDRCVAAADAVAGELKAAQRDAFVLKQEVVELREVSVAGGAAEIDDERRATRSSRRARRRGRRARRLADAEAAGAAAVEAAEGRAAPRPRRGRAAATPTPRAREARPRTPRTSSASSPTSRRAPAPPTRAEAQRAPSRASRRAADAEARRRGVARGVAEGALAAAATSADARRRRRGGARGASRARRRRGGARAARATPRRAAAAEDAAAAGDGDARAALEGLRSELAAAEAARDAAARRATRGRPSAARSSSKDAAVAGAAAAAEEHGAALRGLEAAARAAEDLAAARARRCAKRDGLAAAAAEAAAAGGAAAADEAAALAAARDAAEAASPRPRRTSPRGELAGATRIERLEQVKMTTEIFKKIQAMQVDKARAEGEVAELRSQLRSRRRRELASLAPGAAAVEARGAAEAKAKDLAARAERAERGVKALQTPAGRRAAQNAAALQEKVEFLEKENLELMLEVKAVQQLALKHKADADALRRGDHAPSPAPRSAAKARGSAAPASSAKIRLDVDKENLVKATNDAGASPGEEGALRGPRRRARRGAAGDEQPPGAPSPEAPAPPQHPTT
ncbi:hypothetical protein JL722_11479 [Aureococcus anophagefferens]|nr:hypothetical protein JL722_11479 [Aureococcus anophagefferens]